MRAGLVPSETGREDLSRPLPWFLGLLAIFVVFGFCCIAPGSAFIFSRCPPCTGGCVQIVLFIRTQHVAFRAHPTPIWRHLQRPFFQIQPHSEALGVGTSIYDFWGHTIQHRAHREHLPFSWSPWHSTQIALVISRWCQPTDPLRIPPSKDMQMPRAPP